MLMVFKCLINNQDHSTIVRVKIKSLICIVAYVKLSIILDKKLINIQVSADKTRVRIYLETIEKILIFACTYSTYLRETMSF